jgi:hypothetical protein
VRPEVSTLNVGMTLIVVLNDASSEIYYAQLVEEESTVTVLAALRG